MINLINNPWVIGIFGGIFSGIIVTFISRSLLSRRDRKEYFQKVLSANKEVLYALRPGISEDSIPNGPVIEALITATARKYGVDKKDLYNCSEIGQELLKEVMDSSFIAMNTKTQYCNKLAGIVYPPDDKGEFLEIIATYKAMNLKDYRAMMVTIISTMMGIIAAIMSLFVAVVKRKPEPEPYGIITGIKTSSIYIPIIIIIFTIITILLSLLLTQSLKYSKKKNEKDEGKKED